MTTNAGSAIAVVFLGVDRSIEPFVAQAFARCDERHLSPSEVEAVLSHDVGVVVVVPASLLCDLPIRPQRAPLLAVAHAACVPALDADACDDLIVVPFDRAELEFRITRLARTACASAGSPGLLPDSVALLLDALPMSRTQRDLFAILARQPGRVVTRDALAAAAGVRRDGRALDAHVSRLRRRLVRGGGDPAACPRIVSRRGAGYVLEVPADSHAGLPVDRPNSRVVDNPWILSGRMYCYTDFKL